MAKKDFDFANVPLRYRISDTVKGFMNKSSKKTVKGLEFDEIIYFKKETLSNMFGGTSYIVFYTDGSFVCPNLSNKQINEIKKIEKGYIGFLSEIEKNRGSVNKYSINRLDRAHSYPSELNLERLVENGYALAL